MSIFRAAAMLLLALTLSVLGAACSGSSTESTVDSDAESAVSESSAAPTVEVESTEQGGVIRVANTGMGYQWVNNEVLKMILEGACNVDEEIVSVAPEDLLEALTSGDVHIHMEARTPETVDWFDAAVDAGTLVNLGKTYETDEDFAVDKGASPSFVSKYPEIVEMIRKMDLRGRSLGKVEKWVKKRSRQAGKDVTDEEAAAYYMFEFDFEDRMKSWMPFDKYFASNGTLEAQSLPEQYSGILFPTKVTT